jgi:apolipoprotein N-acyltransferase
MPAVAAAGLLLAGLFASAQPIPQRVGPDTPRVRVVQPNVGQEAMQTGDYDLRMLEAMIDQSGRPQRHPRLIVWPEGAVNFYLEDGYPPDWYYKGTAPVTRGRIASLLGPRDMALVGSTAIEFDERRELEGAGNAIFVVDPAGKLVGRRYDKAHLVPYGEYLPMRPILSRIGLSRLVAGEIDYLAGPGPRTLAVPGFGSIGMQICYEIIFSGEVVDRANRPGMLFNPSNDAWFGAWGPPQHLAQARLRAIEEGLPVVRSTPTGISAVIDAQGRLVGTIGIRRAGAIEVPIPAALPPTIFSRLGSLAAALVAVLMLAAAIAIRRRPR